MSQCRLKEQLLLFIGRLVLQGRDEHGVVKTELYVQYPNISYMFLGQSFMLKTYRSRLIVQKVGNLSVSLVPVVFTDEKKKSIFVNTWNSVDIYYRFQQCITEQVRRDACLSREKRQFFLCGFQSSGWSCQKRARSQ